MGEGRARWLMSFKVEMGAGLAVFMVTGSGETSGSGLGSGPDPD